jgi:hypothetical protein
VRDRDSSETLVFHLLEYLPSALTELLGGRATEGAV